MRAALLPVLFFCSSAFAQTTWHVDLNATPPGDGSPASPYVSIQQALSAATTVHGDTILVAPGEYFETLDFLEKSLVVRATAGPLDTRLLPAAPSDPIVVTIGEPGMANPPAELEGFTITRGALFGRGVQTLDNSRSVLRRCIVSGHDIGAFNDYDLVLEECTIAGNTNGIAGSSLGIHFLSNTICKGNFGHDMLGGAFGPCWSSVYSDFPPDGLAFGCGLDEGNIDAVPSFWSVVSGDYHLRPGSPCIDTGDPSSPLDPDGSRIDMGALTYDPFWAPGTESSCFGDALACPCGNGGSGAGGCDNFQATGGFVLQVMSFAPSGAGGGTAQFLGTGYPPAAAPGSTLIRSPTLEVPPVVFGDGLRCIATAGLVRVGATVALGGTSLHSINHGAGAGTFHYQVWVRSNPATFCNPQAFNLSNAVSVTW